MQFNKHVFFSALTVVLLAVLVCFRFFGDVILHPNEFLFGASGDGLKNYFAVAYQVIHGEGMWFNGMLYPYGDHLIFADGQPLLTKLLSLFIEPTVNNGTQIIGIMNLLMLGSLVITAWCVHRLLIWNHVNPWFAIPFSLTIAFLSPQLARFGGHYALGYTFFVPMSWLLIAGFSRFKRLWLHSLISALIVLAFAFLHPYYLFIFVVFLGSVIGWEAVIKKFQFKQVEHLLARSFALIFPMILFMAYQKWVDPYTDRPSSPSGIFSHLASFQSVFVPVYDPFKHLFNSYFFRIFIPTSWEGNAYIGMVASFTAFASVLVLGRRMQKRKWKILTHPVLPPALLSTFIPGILTLLFAMGVFHHLGLNYLSDFITPLKQFRSLGRMAWIFYYVFSVWTVYHLYVLFRHFRSVKSGKYSYHISVIVGLCAFVWMLDAIVNIKFNKEQMMNRTAKEAFSDHYASHWKSAGVTLENYQAIIPLPFMLVGSEKIGLENGPVSLMHAMKASFSSGLPIIGGTMSRTSLQVTEKSAQLVADPLFPREILADLNPNRKLLLICSNESLSANEQLLVSRAEAVLQTEDYRLYEISIGTIQAIHDEACALEDANTSYSGPSYLKLPGRNLSDDRLWGANCYAMNPTELLFDTVFGSDGMLTISYWVKMDPKTQLLPNWRYTVDNETIDNGGIGKTANLLNGWLLIEQHLETSRGMKHQYMVQSRGGVFSRIQLRPSDQRIVHREGEQLFINNIPIR